jgi:hypothetical protein
MKPIAIGGVLSLTALQIITAQDFVVSVVMPIPFQKNQVGKSHNFLNQQRIQTR